MLPNSALSVRIARLGDCRAISLNQLLLGQLLLLLTDFSLLNIGQFDVEGSIDSSGKVIRFLALRVLLNLDLVLAWSQAPRDKAKSVFVGGKLVLQKHKPLSLLVLSGRLLLLKQFNVDLGEARTADRVHSRLVQFSTYVDGYFVFIEGRLLRAEVATLSCQVVVILLLSKHLLRGMILQILRVERGRLGFILLHNLVILIVSLVAFFVFTILLLTEQSRHHLEFERVVQLHVDVIQQL